MTKETKSQTEAESLQKDGWKNIATKGLGENRVYVMEKAEEPKPEKESKKSEK